MHKLLLPCGYMLAVFALSSIPGDSPHSKFGNLLIWVAPEIQNLLHIPLFAGLAASWLWALQDLIKKPGQCLMVTGALSLLFACFDELYQLGVPGRYGSWTDLSLNAVGILAMSATVYFWQRN